MATRMNDVDLIKLGADFSDRAYSRRTDPLPTGWAVLKPIDYQDSGYQGVNRPGFRGGHLV